jgi:hypothetical protein
MAAAATMMLMSMLMVRAEPVVKLYLARLMLTLGL